MYPNRINDHPLGCPCGHQPRRNLDRAHVSRPTLTPRQREIIVAWLKFDTKDRVAHELFITPSTVKTHIQRIRERYDEVGRPARSKFALFVRAIQDGIIDVTDDQQMLGFLPDRDSD